MFKAKERVPARELASRAMLAGYMNKKGETNTQYKKRYFVLRKVALLSYYKDEESSECLKSIMVDDYALQVPNPADNTLLLLPRADQVAVGEDREYELSALNSTDKRTWANALREASMDAEQQSKQIETTITSKVEAQTKAIEAKYSTQLADTQQQLQGALAELRDLRRKQAAFKQTVIKQKKTIDQATAELNQLVHTHVATGRRQSVTSKDEEPEQMSMTRCIAKLRKHLEAPVEQPTHQPPWSPEVSASRAPPHSGVSMLSLHGSPKGETTPHSRPPAMSSGSDMELLSPPAGSVTNGDGIPDTLSLSDLNRRIVMPSPPAPIREAAKTPEQRLREFYALYDPAKVSRAAEVAAAFAGREEILWQLIERKYRRAIRSVEVPSSSMVVAGAVPAEPLLPSPPPNSRMHASAVSRSDLSIVSDQDLDLVKGIATEMPPKWIDDDSVEGCQVCARSFGLLRRRHHCRRCGRVVCDNCSPEELFRCIPEFGYFAPVRHCRDCNSL